MKRSNNRFIVIIVLVVIVGLTWLILSGKNQVNWSESYEPSDKNPYGTLVLHQLLQNIRNHQPFFDISDTLDKELTQDPGPLTDNYVFIGNRLYIDSADSRKLNDFLLSGNSVFIICNDLQNKFLDSLIRLDPLLASDEDTLFVSDEEESDTYLFEEQSTHFSSFDSVITLSLKNTGVPEYALRRRYEYKPVYNNWTFLSDHLQNFRGDSAEILGMVDGDRVNFVHIPCGRGDLYIHTTPLVFTNYFMLSDTVRDYCREVFSHLGSGHIYWDEENRDFDPDAFESFANSGMPDEGPLEFILSERNLRSAWYLLLAGGLLYLLFGAKRKQRIIPVAEKMDNTSIEYAEVISQLFMKQSDHKKLVLLKMELFRAHLRERFMIRAPHSAEEINEAFYTQISEKSGVSPELIRAIFEQYRYLASIEGVDTPEMLKLHQSISEFHSKSQ